MPNLRAHLGPLSVFVLVVIVGCGGGAARTRGRVVYVTGGGPGSELPSGESGGASAGSVSGSTAGSVSTGSTSGDVGSTSGEYVPPKFGDAALDVGLAKAGVSPLFDRMSGTGEDEGYATIDYSYDEDDGAGDLDADAYVETSAGAQWLSLSFHHRTFVKVGTKLRLEYAYYQATKAEAYENADADEGTAEVVALGPGLSVTIRLDGLTLSSGDAESVDVALSGTIRSASVAPAEGSGGTGGLDTAGGWGGGAANAGVTSGSSAG